MLPEMKTGYFLCRNLPNNPSLKIKPNINIPLGNQIMPLSKPKLVGSSMSAMDWDFYNFGLLKVLYIY